jgi:A/G-specific adenine glycosylase
MMDLGATVCTRNKPTCENCPLKADCEARATRRTHMIPTPRPKRDIPSRQRFLLVMRNPNDEIFLENRPPTGIWANLKSFPEFDSLDDLEAWCTQKGHQTQRMTVLPQRRHTFSHYHLDFTAVICPVNTSNTVSENLQSGWFAPRDVRSLPAPIRTLLAELDPQIADSP